MSCTRVLNCHPHNLIHYSLGHKELSSKDSEPAQSAIRIATVQMMARNKCQLRWLPACPWNVCKRTLRSSLSLHSVPQGPWLQIYPNYNFEDPTFPSLVGSPPKIPILSLKFPALGSPCWKSLFLLPVSSSFKLWNLATKRLSMPWKKEFCVIYMAPSTQRMNTY